MQAIDFAKLNFDTILNTYNIKNRKKRGDEISFSCPFPEHRRGDRRPSASINTKTGAYRCWGCKRDGNLVTLIAEIEGITNSQAIVMLSSSYGGGYHRRDILPEKLDYGMIIKRKFFRKKETVLPELILENFKVDWAKPFKGIQPAYLRKFNIGYDHLSDRVTIPIRNKKNQLMGFKARAIDPNVEPRYITLGDKGNSDKYGFPTFTASNYLFGLDHWNHLSTPLIVEGEFDAMSLIQRGFTAVSINGSNPSENQIKALKDFNKIILLLDPDTAGYAAERFIMRKMIKTHPDSVVAHLPENDPADTDSDTIWKAIRSGQTFIRAY